MSTAADCPEERSWVLGPKEVARRRSRSPFGVSVVARACQSLPCSSHSRMYNCHRRRRHTRLCTEGATRCGESRARALATLRARGRCEEVLRGGAARRRWAATLRCEEKLR